MSTDAKVKLVGTLIVVIICVVIVGIIYTISSVGCDLKAGGMGFPHRLQPFAGCQISPKEGIWVPLENYRYTE